MSETLVFEILGQLSYIVYTMVCCIKRVKENGVHVC